MQDDSSIHTQMQRIKHAYLGSVSCVWHALGKVQFGLSFLSIRANVEHGNRTKSKTEPPKSQHGFYVKMVRLGLK